MPQAISTTDAPAAVGPYSQAIAAGQFVFVSGQLPIDPVTGEFAGETAAEQAERSIANIQAILRAGGLDLSAVVKTTVLLADIADFKAVNEVYARHFSTDPKPARAAFQAAALPLGARVEIEAIAYSK